MNRKLKALGLALLTAFALSAVSAAGASANGEHEFHSEVDHTILDVHGGLQVFTTTPGNLTCETVTGDATTTTKTVNEITGTNIIYSGCERDDGVKTHVKMRSCDYKFTSEGTPDAPVHIECATAGDEIRINATFLGAEIACVRVPAQTPTGGGVSYETIGTGPEREITADVTVSGITYTELGICSHGEVTTTNNGTYNADFTVTGTDTEEKQVGVFFT